jgi:hypothetical protein
MIKRIISAVISLHLLFIVLLLFTSPWTPIQRMHHVKVRTVRPAAVAKTAQPRQAPQPAPSKPKPVAKSANKEAPKPSTASKKKEVLKKPATFEKEKPAKNQPPKEPVWEEIDRALAKIEMKSLPKAPLLPQALTFSEEANVEKLHHESPEVLLMGFLQGALHLPEVGEVKIQLTVEKDGTISKVVVVSAESQKNKLYLQEHLPLLRLPTPPDQKKTWTLTFYNEI